MAEDRKAAARRAAREIIDAIEHVFGVCAFGGPFVETSRQVKIHVEGRITATLLAFPGRDAKPAAWRSFSGGQWQYAATREDAERRLAGDHEPLYVTPVAGKPFESCTNGIGERDFACDLPLGHEPPCTNIAPGAGEAGALREALGKVLSERMTPCDDEPEDCGHEWQPWDCIRAALALDAGKEV